MKKILPLLLLLQCILVVSPLWAQSKDEAAVATAIEALRKAMIEADKATLENLAAEELSYGHSNGKIENKAEFVQAIVSGSSDFVSIDLTNQTIRIVDKTAIVRHTFSAATNNNGQPGTIKLTVLLVWQKQKGNWKLLARQTARI